MKYMKRRFGLIEMCSWVAGASLLSLSTFAQQTDNQQDKDTTKNVDGPITEELIVTGSRLMGPDQSTSPMVQLNVETQYENPSVNVADFLRDNVTANNGNETRIDESNQSGRANTGDRSTGVNLWGLGKENTLTLLAGSRLVSFAAPSNTGWFSVDANSILPGIAMGRADILLDGGSALYGTDAVAGVANFVPRYGFEGVELRAQSEVFPSAFPDTSSFNLEGLFGTKFGDDRGSLIAAFDYRKANRNLADDLELNDADVAQFTGSETTAQYEDLLFAGGAAYDWSATAAGGGGGMGMGMGMGGGGGATATALTDPLCGRDDLVNAPYYYVGEVVPGDATEGAGTCAGYPTPDIDGRKGERYTLFGAVEWAFTDTIVGSLAISHNYRENVDFVEFDTNNGGSNTLITPIPASHPAVLYNNSIDATWATVGATGMGAGLPIDGRGVVPPVAWDGETTYESETTNIRTGLEIALGASTELNLGVSYGMSEVYAPRFNAYTQRYIDGLNGLGGPNCDPATGTAGMDGCEYYNPFISALLPDAASLGLANSDELVNYIFPPNGLERFFETDMFVIDAVLSVSTGLELAGGGIDVVVGAEYVEESFDRNVNEALMTGGVLDGFANPLQSFSGEQEAYAIFAETVLPFTDTFRLQVAGRFSDYQGIGTTFNPKIGVMFDAHDRVRLRASFGTSFKAPTIVHTNDDLSTGVIAPRPTGGRRGGQRVTSVITGDPNIEPQQATHFSIGGDFTLFENAGALEDLTLTVSYIDIDFEDRIAQLTEADRLPNAVGVGECATVIEDANGDLQWGEFFLVGSSDGLPCFEGTDTDGSGTLDLDELTTTYRTFTNLATSDLQGLNLSLSSRINTPAGLLSIGLNGTYTLDYDVQASVDDPIESAVGVAGVLGAANDNVPEWRANAPVRMLWGEDTFLRGHSTILTARYSSEIEDSAGGLNTGETTTLDLVHNWNINDKFTIGLSARNLTGEKPEVPPGTDQNVRIGETLYFLSLAYTPGPKRRGAR